MQHQAERFDTEVLIDYVTEIDVNGPPFTVTTAMSGVFKTKSINRGHGRVTAAAGWCPTRSGSPVVA